ncbi:MAG TPA: hydroxyacylglutathione hydrolase [Hyphomicrobiales bacterium]|nr:hydroxyacylglutathione hydrolase [Hyphomicrobiales bacterium]
MAVEIRLIPCLTDNYAVLLHDPASGATAVVDAPEAAPIEAVLDKEGWRLSTILVTHHHHDHTGGIEALVRRFHPEVVAPAGEAAKIPAVTRTVKEGDCVSAGGADATVIETPGHTLGQINYFFDRERLLFGGDTLFTLGCGRVIEGDPDMMWRSLDKLRRLPGDTRLYCGHEYTEANARFALSVDPDNARLKARAEAVRAARGRGEPTVPATLAEELDTNPFLRPEALAAAVGLAGAAPAKVFAEIRGRKDRF